MTIHERILPLGAVIWAAAGKALGFTPEGIINEIRRTARYTDADFRRLASDPPVDPAATMIRLHDILIEAETFVASMPTDRIGLLFLTSGKVVQPDPDPEHARGNERLEHLVPIPHIRAYAEALENFDAEQQKEHAQNANTARTSDR